MSLAALLGVARLGMLCILCGAQPETATGKYWLDVPFVAQVRNGCGPACVSMVMKYWAAALHRGTDGNADEAVIRGRLNPLHARGVFARDLSGYFDSHGFRAYAFTGNWSDLKHHLAKGRPLIVAVAQSLDNFHYMVVVGIDGAQDALIVNDPARRKLLELKRTAFEKAWSRCGQWTLLALPEDAI